MNKLKQYTQNEHIGLEYASQERKVYELIKKARWSGKQSVLAHKNKDFSLRSTHTNRIIEIIHMLNSCLNGNNEVVNGLKTSYAIMLHRLGEAIKKPENFEQYMNQFDSMIQPIEEAWGAISLQASAA